MSLRERIAKILYERIYYTAARRKDDPKGLYQWPPTATKKWFDHAGAVLGEVQIEVRALASEVPK